MTDSSLLSLIHFHFSELPYGTPHPERQKECNRGRVEEGGCISPSVEMEGTVAAVHPRQYLLKSNPLLYECSAAPRKKGNGNKVILLHTAQRGRERDGGERSVEKERHKVSW
ncbi:hypothetical protein OYC64_020219 [Pagothenia borchgrevinki]|uniref:Uncharacterized protein n=1 Tax=Pagothenia borchgrevinki TaxID=8213 RepID=A0ABD2FL14_PAGBO